MGVTKQEAVDALEQVKDATALTRRALADGGTSTILIAWGSIWMVGFLTMHFWPRLAGPVWLPLDLVGIAATFIAVWRSPVKNPAGAWLGVFWFLLFVYAWLWIILIAAGSPAPVRLTGEQLAAYICTVVMFAYVVMGLWLRSLLLLCLGLVVTATTVLSFFLLAPQFYLIMAFAGGGALIGAGIGLRVGRR